MTKTTTLTLKAADLLVLLNSMEAEFTDHMTEEELAQHDKLYARLTKAFERVDVHHWFGLQTAKERVGL